MPSVEHNPTLQVFAVITSLNGKRRISKRKEKNIPKLFRTLFYYFTLSIHCIHLRSNASMLALSAQSSVLQPYDKK